MSNARQSGAGSLEVFAHTVKTVSPRGPAPVHLWNPPFCGDLDMRIAADGTWFYLGTPIGRPALVKLFASILKREGDAYFLVTPVEKCGITVDDAPFAAVELQVREGAAGRELHLRTNVDEAVCAGPEHPLRFATEASGGIRPYVLVRANLWARLTRALWYDLAGLGEVRDVDGREMFGVASAAAFFAIGPADGLEGIAAGP